MTAAAHGYDTPDDWQPGDPLAQYGSWSRPLFELMTDVRVLDVVVPPAWCTRCGVGWDGPGLCWCCGRPGLQPDDDAPFWPYQAAVETARTIPTTRGDTTP